MLDRPLLRCGTRWSPALVLAGGLLAGCGGVPGQGTTGAEPSPSPTTPSISEQPPPDPGTVACNPNITVESESPALLVKDPAVLAHFRLERVLTQLIDLAGDESVTPKTLLQRLFDTQNTAQGGAFTDVIHCDSPGNGAFKNGPAVDCPRAEGALAHSEGLLLEGDPDYFAPVALVNRFDLTPTTVAHCGEYRIVYAKQSGRTDPQNRVFLIFEGVIPMPAGQLSGVMNCRPVVEAWTSLEKQVDPEQRAATLEQVYFTGLAGFQPLVHPKHFGVLGSEDGAYGSTMGQVRLSQRMQDPWEMRELHLLVDPATGALSFAPVTTKNSPVPDLFDPANQSPLALDFRSGFPSSGIAGLTGKDPAKLRMLTSNMYNAGESAVDGPGAVDFAARAQGSELWTALAQQITPGGIGSACPPEDPLTAEHLLHRATTQTCAGCHAPERFLGPERKLGCGVTWPATLGEAHIDEQGALSPALTDVFLPRRAEVITTFLQACDMEAIQANLQPVPASGIPK
jgi:hypothetical protein